MTGVSMTMRPDTRVNVTVASGRTAYTLPTSRRPDQCAFGEAVSEGDHHTSHPNRLQSGGRIDRGARSLAALFGLF